MLVYSLRWRVSSLVQKLRWLLITLCRGATFKYFWLALRCVIIKIVQYTVHFNRVDNTTWKAKISQSNPIRFPLYRLQRAPLNSAIAHCVLKVPVTYLQHAFVSILYPFHSPACLLNRFARGCRDSHEASPTTSDTVCIPTSASPHERPAQLEAGVSYERREKLLRYSNWHTNGKARYGKLPDDHADRE